MIMLVVVIAGEQIVVCISGSRRIKLLIIGQNLGRKLEFADIHVFLQPSHAGMVTETS